jgi:hypothetical protein
MGAPVAELPVDPAHEVDFVYRVLDSLGVKSVLVLILGYWLHTLCLLFIIMD